MYPKNMLDYFDCTVQNNPDKIALIHGEESLSFSDLADRSQKLADYIAELVGEYSNRPICIFFPKSFEVVIGDIAALYSGNFFNNLDVEMPESRLRNILKVLNPIAIITNNTYRPILQGIEITCPIINLDENAWEKTWGHKNELNEKRKQQIDTDPLCIINTSGSTGTPKGVLLTHRSYIEFLNWAIDTFHFSGSEILGTLNSIVFDLYIYETCLMMVRGVTLVLLDKKLAAFPARLLQESADKHVNYIFWVPTIMANIANMGLLAKIPLPDLRLVWFCGEVLPTHQFNLWKQQYPNATFVNLYGPCETSVSSTYYIVDRELKDEEPIPIGGACRNTDVLLLNDQDKPCKVNETGEICIRGTSLAMGYYNNPEKTAAAFVQNPLNHLYPEKIYRTGDLAYKNTEGLLIFQGRKDNLIKHMGNRINLSEIEHIAIDTVKAVSNCCIVYNIKKGMITMFYESNGKSSLEIRKLMATQLPRYMLPNAYHEMKCLPRNINGKIDRKYLKEFINQN